MATDPKAEPFDQWAGSRSWFIQLNRRREAQSVRTDAAIFGRGDPRDLMTTVTVPPAEKG